MNDEIILEGNVENIIFYNMDNGYTVFVLDVNSKEIICTGYFGKVNEGENLKLFGNYTVHPSYGEQFNVRIYEKTIPTTLHGMEKYLASGVIKGIGEVLAKRIVDTFGENTFEVIEEYPERLSKVKGISSNKAKEVHAVFHEQRELRVAILFLQDYGVSPSLALRIYKKYKSKTLSIIQTNPYLLASDIFGVGFKTADDIAHKIGIESNSPFRIKSGITHVLSKSSNDGHVFLPKTLLIQKSVDLLSINSDLIENSIMELQLNKEIFQDTINNINVIYLSFFYYAENFIAQKLLELSTNILDKSKDAEILIKNVEEENKVFLADKQKEAVLESLSNGVLVITGGPGTGKTMTINTIIKILKKDNFSIELAAPTGRAAKKMTEATGVDAKTIHRLLGISFLESENKKQFFERDNDNPIEADVIIIDESSMIDVSLMSSLLLAIAPGTRLILVGDVDQLPSVGPGNILKDIINSGYIKIVKLNEIFRQAQESAIIMNAHKINKGEYPILNEQFKDFFFVKRNNIDTICDTIIDLITNRLPKFKKNINSKNIQVLAPMKKSQIGVENLNIMLQENLNPKSPNKKEYLYRNTIFRVDDKVMQLKNNYNITWVEKNPLGKISNEGTGIFNGDEGIIKNIDTLSETITVCFDENKFVEYDFSQLDEIDLAYAVTIHKSQGSEYNTVIIPIYNGPPMLLNRNLLYTAITRAKELVVLVGKEEALYKMVDNIREIERYSSLDKRIKQYYKFVVG